MHRSTAPTEVAIGRRPLEAWQAVIDALGVKDASAQQLFDESEPLLQERYCTFGQVVFCNTCWLADVWQDCFFRWLINELTLTRTCTDGRRRIFCQVQSACCPICIQRAYHWLLRPAAPGPASSGKCLPGTSNTFSACFKPSPAGMRLLRANQHLMPSGAEQSDVSYCC